jgi:DNA recombination protein RmuC
LATVAYLLIGAALGAFAGYFFARSRAGAVEHQARNLAERLALAEPELIALRDKLARAETQLAEERRQSAENFTRLTQAREELRAQFESLAARILEEKTAKFTEQNQAQVGALLTPLREQLGEFKRKVEETYITEAKERSALGEQVRLLSELNQQIGLEAQNLTRALRGDNKLQGNWGEQSIERIFELSGLEAGRGYEAQVAREGADGSRQLPDFVVHLPGGRDIIVDSKVSLAAFHDAVAAGDDATRDAALGRLCASVRAHFKGLASKEYQRAAGVQSLDYVLLCMPSEPAFIAALRHDATLAEEALAQRVILVSTTTLLHSLKIIANLWRIDDQNRNAARIAEEGGKLYDQFVAFVSDLEQVGQRIEQAQDAYAGAHKRLSTGRGNLVRKAEELRKLGLKTSKDLPRSLVDDGAADEPDDGP